MLYDIAMSENNVTPIRNPKVFFTCSSVYVRLCLFLASPEQLPANVLCAIKAVIIYSAINIILLDSHTSAFEVIVKIVFEISLLAGIVFYGLKIAKKPERFLQTMSALIGVGMIISLISTPLYLLITPEFKHTQEISQAVINITLILLVWNLSIISFIFKRSFDISTFNAALISFTYLFLFQVLISASFGSAT